MWTTAEQACARLQIKRKTLYTYVSRGWIRAQATSGRRKRYLAADVEELARRAAEASGSAAAAGAALRWGPPVLSSALTAIDPDGPYYRGRSAVGLAEQGATAEQVVECLWGEPLSDDRPSLGPCPRAGWALPDAVTAALVLHQPASRSDVLWTVCAAVAWCGPQPDVRAKAALEAPTLAEALAAALGVPAPPRLDAALVLCADHELNASTFAARVAASTDAPDARCIVAALAAWGGPRHGLASEAIEDALDAGQAPPAEGFQHPLYPQGDPRGELLMALSGPPPVSFLARPSLDAGLVAFRRAHLLPRGAASAIFLVGRCIGWLAHIHEQRGQPMLRPRARYVGPSLTG